MFAGRGIPELTECFAAAALLTSIVYREMNVRRSERAVDHYTNSDAPPWARVLLVSDELRGMAGIQSRIGSTTAELICVSTIEEALLLTSREHLSLIIVDRHLGGWLGPEVCKALVTKARPAPVVGLINEECVLDLRDGIEAGLAGVYYRSQIETYLMRYLAKLAHIGQRVPTSLANGGTSWTKRMTRRSRARGTEACRPSSAEGRDLRERRERL